MRTHLKLSIYPLLALIMMLNPFCLRALKTQDPGIVHGFRLIEKRFVKEADADCYFFEHIKTGARLLKIENDDPNKTFSVTFHTIPNSDCGEAHIIEHSVLNGSKNFPVKSPFDIIVKGSLNTYINALTYKDRTSYPVSSINDKDYFNLMHIYLDAVFNPLIYNDERIFMQEGWHYELTDKDSPVQYRGVVYGEMKGDFSSPFRYLSLHLYRNLFPNTSYGFESGGFPSAIPSLTYEKFLDFHRTYYHPSNSYFILYGNADYTKELEFINENYLKNYGKGKRFLIEDQKPFTGLKDVSEFYPVMEGADINDQTFLSLSYVYTYNNDLVIPEALNLLSFYLFNREASPIRIALQNAGIGKDVSCSSIGYKQNVMHIIARNANARDRQRFYDIVTNELRRIADEGINKLEFESLLNRYEFEMREDNSSNKGITHVTNNVMPNFIYQGNPFVGLEYEKLIVKLRVGLQSRFYEELIQKAMIDNPHSLLLSLEPKPGMDKQIAEKEKEELEVYKKSLSNDQIEKLIKGTNELIAYQQSDDTPEALATIPMLSIDDIDPKTQFYGVKENRVGNNIVIHRNEHTNGIVYSNLYFDLRVLPQDQIQYAALLANVVGLLNTQNYSYGDLDTEINKNTGGIYSYITYFLENNDDTKLIPKMVITSKATSTKIQNLIDINEEIISRTRFDDAERLKTVLNRVFSQLDAQIKREGASTASLRFMSYFTNGGMFQELIAGYDYYMFVSSLVKNYDQMKAEITSNLSEVAKKIFTRENLIVGTTCSSENYDDFAGMLSKMVTNLKPQKLQYLTWDLKPTIKNEGFQTASKVQYVNSGFDFKKLGYEWSGKMLVLNRAISRNWLYQQLRVVGGAYGGYSRVSANGIFSFISYRDPNLKETVENYKSTPDFLRSMVDDPKELTQLIIGTISALDKPSSASGRGETAFLNYFKKLNEDFYQNERNEVLSTTIQDLKDYAEMIEKILDQNVLCIYGNAEKIEQNKDLFQNLVRID